MVKNLYWIYNTISKYAVIKFLLNPTKKDFLMSEINFYIFQHKKSNNSCWQWRSLKTDA